MIAAIYARKSTAQDDVADEAKSRHAASRGRARLHRREGLDARRRAHLHRRRRERRAVRQPRRVPTDDARRRGAARSTPSCSTTWIASAATPARRWWRSTRWRISASRSGTTRTGQQVDLDSFEGEMMTFMKARFAQQYRDQVRKHTRDAMRQKAEQGFVTGGKVFGYDNLRDREGPRRAAHQRGRGRHRARHLRPLRQRRGRAQHRRGAEPQRRPVAPCAAGAAERLERVHRPRRARAAALSRRGGLRPDGESLRPRARQAPRRAREGHDRPPRGPVAAPRRPRAAHHRPRRGRTRRCASARPAHPLPRLGGEGRPGARAGARQVPALSGGMLVCPTVRRPLRGADRAVEGAGQRLLCATRRRKPGVCTNTLALPIAETDDDVLGIVEGEVLGTRFIEELLALVDRRRRLTRRRSICRPTGIGCAREIEQPRWTRGLGRAGRDHRAGDPRAAAADRDGSTSQLRAPRQAPPNIEQAPRGPDAARRALEGRPARRAEGRAAGPAAARGTTDAVG